MTYFLRDRGNRTIVYLDFTGNENDFHVVVCIVPYSEFLLSINKDRRRNFVNDMAALQELRGEWFEWKGQPSGEPHNIHHFAKMRLIQVARRWDFDFVID